MKTTSATREVAIVEKRIRRLNDRYQAAKANGHAASYIRRAGNLSRMYLTLRKEVEA